MHTHFGCFSFLSHFPILLHSFLHVQQLVKKKKKKCAEANRRSSSWCSYSNDVCTYIMNERPGGFPCDQNQEGAHVRAHTHTCTQLSHMFACMRARRLPTGTSAGFAGLEWRVFNRQTEHRDHLEPCRATSPGHHMHKCLVIIISTISDFFFLLKTGWCWSITDLVPSALLRSLGSPRLLSPFVSHGVGQWRAEPRCVSS